MSIKLRLIQIFDPAHEKEFMDLEKKFAELEAKRPDFPKGQRYQILSSALPKNTLVWESEFKTLDEANRALNFFSGDPAHEDLAEKQRPYFKEVRVEFLERL